jgi:hypothetical protein
LTTCTRCTRQEREQIERNCYRHLGLHGSLAIAQLHIWSHRLNPIDANSKAGLYFFANNTDSTAIQSVAFRYPEQQNRLCSMCVSVY